ncbi:hypothetical protein AWB76_06297 [Caballeronia temeraria]|uniref:Uncharacterized protein n=1 Tax=Caballeronia temeraria TaxID=1777137 RepID=A0A158D173_9BURK|nr:hypothetical protein [Caballeronia temeraria]SAK88211.1 hypothetical protein AWB76_06297 [Caballeronia temeraria]
MLKFNPDTNIIFDNEEAAVAPIREITRDEIPDLIANGAGVDPSANVGEQTSSPAQTDGDAQAAQDPAVSATGSDTAGEQGNAEQTAANGAAVEQGAGSDTTSAAPVDSASTPDAGDAGNGSGASSVDVSPAVISDAQADPGGAGAADLSPTPAAPNLDAQSQASVSSDAVPLDVGGAADAEAGGAEAGEPDAALSASQTGSGSDEHPLTIIGEIEALVRMVGNAAVHEYQRLIQRLADLKNHPTIKDGE